jgi:hypothetical protein
MCLRSASGPHIQPRTEGYALLQLKTFLATVPATALTIGPLQVTNRDAMPLEV